MESNWVYFIKLVFILYFQNACYGSTSVPTRDFTLRLPQAKPTQPETYVCTPLRLDKSSTYYILGFEPLAEKYTAHHMLLYGCKTPGRKDKVFNCGAMTAKQEDLNSALSPCGSGSHVVYAWALNAPELILPEGVGFRVGGPDSDIDWLVLQVHYASIDRIPEEGDNTGVKLRYTNVPQPKSAGVYYTISNGRMPSETVTNVEAACKLAAKYGQVIHPFAFRTHTHDLGTAVSGWKVSPDMTWTLIGKQDPQMPQMFYPVADNSTTMTQGDRLATRCTMDNFKDHAVWMGTTREDEMCNFYMMYWVDGTETMSESICRSNGPPLYSWDGWLFGGGLTNIPDTEASSID